MSRPTAAVVAAVLLLAAAGCSGSSSPSAGTADHRATTTTSAGSATLPTTSPPTTAGTPASSAADTKVADQAFLAGFPLVTTERTIQTFAGLFGVNTLFRAKALSTDQSKLVVGPNHDTLYALAVLDLRVGPQVLTVPRITDRYYVFQFIDAWMDTIGYVGTRATHAEAGKWVVVPPGYTGTIPAGLHRIDSPTNQLVMLGRVRAVDGPDVVKAYAATAGTRLQLLGSLTGGPAPATLTLGKPAGSAQTVGHNGIAYWDELGNALAINPPVTAAARSTLAAASRLGVGAGRHPSIAATASTKVVLAVAVTDEDRHVEDDLGRVAGTVTDGWRVNLSLGDPTKPLSLLDQAIVARHFWGPNEAAEAVYPQAVAASDGQPLTGAKDYVIHLAAGHLPPVKAFWSYTVYGEDSFLVANPIGRFSVSGQTPGLVKGADGSIDIYLSHDPVTAHLANWLPTPAGPYRLALRLYLPGPAILHGTYRYPPVTVRS